MLKTHKRLLVEKPSLHGGAYHVDTQISIRFFKFFLYVIWENQQSLTETGFKKKKKKSNSIFLCLITFLQLKLLKESFTAPDGWCFEGDWFINPELRFVQTYSQIHSFRTDHEIKKYKFLVLKKKEAKVWFNCQLSLSRGCPVIIFFFLP